jgi:hypothetical protein
MTITKIILTGAAAVTIISSAAWAQQSLTGTVTKIDRINGTIAIQQEQSGTVGASIGSAGEEFKAQRGVSLDDVHAGDKVTVSTAETGGSKTVTKIEKSKE